METTAYILLRTKGGERNPFLDTALQSVGRQDYASLALIALIDAPAGADISGEEQALDAFRAQYPQIAVHCCRETCGSAAGAFLAVRRKFAALAEERDIAFLLDDDDVFLTENAVSRVVSVMDGKGAHICMIGFEIMDDCGKNIISRQSQDEYSQLLGQIASHKEACLPDEVQRLHTAASMGWTKCCRRWVFDRFLDMVATVDARYREEGKTGFVELGAYEDFPDYGNLLLRGVRLTAVPEALYGYRKHVSSVTASQQVDDFRIRRIGFLHYLKDGVSLPATRSSYIPQAGALAEDFIRYKLQVICGILEKSPLDYSPEDFLRDYENR